ncbi:hypothetical protein [Caldifermentibacillus hisashii]|uniref:hypothetical protein n=1 Tax=Caldifermentibacillus hisashii TaxID=996558 RepID=UPI0034D79B44
MATSPILVTILRWEMPIFGDEPESRHQFGSKMLNFGDEACSRHRFEVGNAYFWRRA